MACRVNFLENGKIGKVYTPNGQESIVFNKLSSLPFNSREVALETYKQGLEATDITFTLNGVDYPTYKEAVSNCNGEDVVINGLTEAGDKKKVTTRRCITKSED